MISSAFQKTVYSWAKTGKTGKTDFKKVLALSDTLKGIGKGKAVAILAPSYLMHKINYQSLINNPNVHTMAINNGYLMPGTAKCEYYLPLTTVNKTRSMNRKPGYAAWRKKYPGLVMHGVHYNDGTNTAAPYPLASLGELKEIVLKCPTTKFSAWHHAWGDYIKKKGVPGMLETPFFDKWTPRRIPWAHCGALSGFAIPLCMALGYSRIFIVGMGFRFVVNGYHNPPKQGGPGNQSQVAQDSWLHVAPTRFKNQAECAKKNGIVLKVGPSKLLEPELPKFFDTFGSLSEVA